MLTLNGLGWALFSCLVNLVVRAVVLGVWRISSLATASIISRLVVDSPCVS